MTRNSWSTLARSAIVTLRQRLARRPWGRFSNLPWGSFSKLPHRLRRQIPDFAPLMWPAEVLEVRALLSSAANDSYSVVHDHTLNASPSILNNDTRNGPQWVPSVVSGVAHGSLTLNSYGTFTYVPSTSFVGNDSWTYHVWDGINYTNTATVTT